MKPEPCPAGIDPDRWKTVVRVAMDAAELLSPVELNWLKLYGITRIQRAFPVINHQQGEQGDHA